MKKFLCILFLNTLLLHVYAGSIIMPKEPSEPVMDGSLSVRGPEKGRGVAVEIKLQGRPSVNGRILFMSSGFYASPKGKNRKYYSLSDMRMVKVTKWKAERSGGRAYRFYPSEYSLNLKDGKKESVSGNIPLFNRLAVRVDGTEKKIYTYYYDYLKNGIWENSGRNGNLSEFRISPDGCAVSIELNW